MNVEIEWKHNCHFSYWYSSNGQKSAIFIWHPGPNTNLNMTVENNDNDYHSSCVHVVYCNQNVVSTVTIVHMACQLGKGFAREGAGDLVHY